MNYKITWQKPNGSTIERILTHNPYYEIGYVNSYDWQVIDIKVMRNNMWLDVADYQREIHKSMRSSFRTNFIKKTIKDNQLLFIVVLLYILLKLI